jgi:hypothetical protein
MAEMKTITLTMPVESYDKMLPSILYCIPVPMVYPELVLGEDGIPIEEPLVEEPAYSDLVHIKLMAVNYILKIHNKGVKRYGGDVAMKALDKELIKEIIEMNKNED